MSALQIRAASTAVGQRSLGCLLLLRLRRLLLGVAAVVAPLLPAGTAARRPCRRPIVRKAGAMYEKYDGGFLTVRGTEDQRDELFSLRPTIDACSPSTSQRESRLHGTEGRSGRVCAHHALVAEVGRVAGERGVHLTIPNDSDSFWATP
jgi:hypothetical protein